MNKIIMVCGLPASGKSTAAQELAVEHNAAIHSSDQMRKKLFGSEDVQDGNDLVFQELHKSIKQDLSYGVNVIYDATNINHKKRKVFLDSLSKYDVQKICYLIATPYEKCLEQDKLRDRKVPEHVIERMYKSFYIPQMYEGWDKIEIIWNTEGYILDTNDLFNGENGLNKIDQENKHHTLTIGEHCLRCFENCMNLSDDFELTMAAMYHDIGKRFCKAFKNGKGEVTEYATYYQHHLVSAYDSLFIFKQQNFEEEMILRIVNYIQWHMQPFFIETERAKNKFIGLVGQEFYDKLMVLHEADVKAK